MAGGYPERAHMTEGDMNAIAWRDFIHWAIGDADVLKQFSSETGHDAEGEWLLAFIDWATVNLWGEEYAPQAWKNQNRPEPQP